MFRVLMQPRRDRAELHEILLESILRRLAAFYPREPDDKSLVATSAPRGHDGLAA